VSRTGPWLNCDAVDLDWRHHQGASLTDTHGCIMVKIPVGSTECKVVAPSPRHIASSPRIFITITRLIGDDHCYGCHSARSRQGTRAPQAVASLDRFLRAVGFGACRDEGRPRKRRPRLRRVELRAWVGWPSHTVTELDAASIAATMLARKFGDWGRGRSSRRRPRCRPRFFGAKKTA
jgi:hypothetical protein